VSGGVACDRAAGLQPGDWGNRIMGAGLMGAEQGSMIKQAKLRQAKLRQAATEHTTSI